ncbi:MAG: manganese efflux pump MntP family protein [Clostridia bacterium]|nr:manganese efflux pump MntP family protein [Clostridia bacterium]
MAWSLVLSVFLSGVSLSIDAFAVSVCDGMVYQNLKKRNGVLIPLTFGLFQALMPIIGFYVGMAFLNYIDAFDHWIAFALLLIIGGKMIFDGIKELRAKEEQEVKIKKFSIAEVLVQGVATSIDALAVGFSLNSMLEGVGGNTQLWAWLSVIAIGVITFAISLGGLLIGVKAGKLFKKKASIAQIIGGVVLILIGIKIVLGGYGIINF